MPGFTVFGAVGSGSIPVEATLTLLGIPYELIEFAGGHVVNRSVFSRLRRD